ncbi:MAG: hypothetical protein EXR86_16475 [Gammaproteobacteria bacterium]|nr:hypothetical protein [Gammaproteobacteria bacterium]
MALDSDVSGADAQLHVEFYTHDRDPHKGKAFVRIMTPGDKYNIIDQPVREDHRERFPRQWLWYQMQNGESPSVGTPLAMWHKARPEEISDGQLQELSILRFQTVEQVATASDMQIQRVGMGATGLRERARLFLHSTSGDNSETKAKLAKTETELEALKAQVMALVAARTDRTGDVIKRRPGRPPLQKG